MIEKLQNKQARKYFYIIIICLLLIIFLVRYFLIPYIRNETIVFNVHSLNEILDSLFTSILVTVGLAIFLFWLTPQNKLNAQIKILQPVEIGETIIKARTNTEKWWFNGGSGRYTRTVTLPYLANYARQNNKRIEIKIQIMNPKNDLLCEKYASYKNSLRTADKSNQRTKESVQLDLISTIVSAFAWKTEQPFLEITFGLKDSFSLFRTDLSSSGAIITKEDPIEPGILYEHGTFFYSAQAEDFTQSFNQTIQLDTNILFKKIDQLTESDIGELLTKLDISVNSKYLKTILSKLKTDKNPYA